MSLLSLLGSYGRSEGDDSSPIITSVKEGNNDVIEIIDENSNNGSISKSFSIVDYDHEEGDEEENDDRATYDADNNNNNNNNTHVTNNITKVKIFTSPTSSSSSNNTNTNNNNNSNLSTISPFINPKTKNSVVFTLLPPPPQNEPDIELQDKLSSFFEKKRKGSSINQSIRLERTFRNPNILGEILKFYAVDDRSSCYPKEIFDPQRYDKEDYYDSISDTQKILENRRDSKRIDFIEPNSKTGQSAKPTTTTNVSTSTNNNNTTQSPTNATDTVTDGSKKRVSKWDNSASEPVSKKPTTTTTTQVAVQSGGSSAYAEFKNLKKKEAELRALSQTATLTTVTTTTTTSSSTSTSTIVKKPRI